MTSGASLRATGAIKIVVVVEIRNLEIGEVLQIDSYEGFVCGVEVLRIRPSAGSSRNAL
jgi:hypothetical protein